MVEAFPRGALYQPLNGARTALRQPPRAGPDQRMNKGGGSVGMTSALAGGGRLDIGGSFTVLGLPIKN
jgi:hypothetical protein